MPAKKSKPPKSSKPKPLPADLAKFRDTYVELFGTLPPLPTARFEFSGEINPEFLRLSEKLRAHAFYSDVIDGKTTQLILFGMLLVEHNPIGAGAHALAARRLGASWEELHKVVELAAATGALGPSNQGSNLLKTLRDKEQGA
jgi:4-carboxymuconolactone decarboxylase